MVTVPFENLPKERIINLFAAAAITTAANIALIPAPLAFSKLDFFSDIPVLLFIPPAMSLSRSLRYSPRWIWTLWRRGGDVPCSADCSIRKILVEIRATSM